MDSEDDKVGNLRIKDLRNADFEDREIPGSKLRQGNGGDSPIFFLSGTHWLIVFFPRVPIQRKFHGGENHHQEEPAGEGKRKEKKKATRMSAQLNHITEHQIIYQQQLPFPTKENSRC